MLLQTPPGSMKFNIANLRNSFSFFKDPVAFTQKNRALFGSLFAFKLFGMPFLFLCDSKYKDWALNGEGDYLKNDWQPTLTRLFWPSTLPLLEGERHLKQRQLAAQILQDRFTNRLAEMKSFIDSAVSAFSQNSNFVCERDFKKLTAQIASVSFLGRDLDLLQSLEVWVAGFFAPLPLDLPWTTFGAGLQQKKQIKNKILAEIRKTPQLYAKYEMREEDLAEELQHLMFASYNTTAVALTNCMVLLSMRPDVKNRLRGAITADDSKLTENPLGCSDLNGFIFFILTQIPSVIGIFRETKRNCQLENYEIPRGWKVVLQPSHETLLTDDRFILKNKTPIEEIFSSLRNRKSDSFYPFGAGARTCLGKNVALNELALVLISFLKKYDWSTPDQQDLSYKKMPFPLPRSGLKIELKDYKNESASA